MRDTAFDSIFIGDGLTFPYLNWSIFDEIDFTGDGTENNRLECISIDDYKIQYFFERN